MYHIRNASTTTAGRSFSPLFIGEVNVTTQINRCRNIYKSFQSPFHRGSKCNSATTKTATSAPRPFSPLFIGEVNVTLVDPNDTLPANAFSPLFIGEVNVTNSSMLWDMSTKQAFSPLFIGEVNVTMVRSRRFCYFAMLSVPFSSGK